MKTKGVGITIPDLRSIKIPDLEEVSQPYRSAKGKVSELWERLAAIDRRVHEIRIALAEETSPRDQLASRAYRLLVDGGLALPDNELAAMRDELGRLLDERRVVSAAIELAKQEVNRLHCEASRIACDQIREQWVAIAGNYVSILIAAGAAFNVYKRLREALRDKDVKFPSYLPVVLDSGLGDPSDSNSRTSWILRDAVREGLISEGDIPEEWLASWGK